MTPIAKTLSRVREWIWDHPGRARMAVAAVVVTAVAGGALVGLRGGDADSGRLRHRQYSGSAENNGSFEGDQLEVPSDSTAPAGADGSAPASDRPGSPAGAGTTRPGVPATVGRSADPMADGHGSSTSTTSGRAALPKPSPGTTPTTRPAGTGSSGPPATATTAAPGWALLPKAPIGPRTEHTAVWTGREMVIWGGTPDFETDPATDGAAYDPVARTWRKLPGAPLTPRLGARAYWTGREMLVLGGASVDGEVVADGAAWDSATNTWRSIPDSPLGRRDGAVVAWAGDRLVIWSGHTVPPSDTEVDPELKNDGAAYVPATNTWVPIGPAPIPPRSGAQSAWAGSRLIVTGGEGNGGDDDRTDGAALDPVSGAWSPIAARPEPGSCGGDIACSGLWTGTTLLFPTSALAYDPTADRWSAIAPAPGADAPALGEPAVWAGRQMLAWGVPAAVDDGSGADTAGSDDGPVQPAAAMYDPVANRWQKFPAGPLRGRSSHSAVWTGEALLIWGGQDAFDGTVLADGAAYRPE